MELTLRGFQCHRRSLDDVGYSSIYTYFKSIYIPEFHLIVPTSFTAFLFKFLQIRFSFRSTLVLKMIPGNWFH